MTRRPKRTIRGILGDRVVVTVTPDPLDEALGLPPIPRPSPEVVAEVAEDLARIHYSYNAHPRREP